MQLQNSPRKGPPRTGYFICHIGNELPEYDPTCTEGCGDAGKVDLIEVPASVAEKHLGNPDHSYGDVVDYLPGSVGASGEGNEDTDGDGIDEGCEIPPPCPCWAASDLLSVTAANNLLGASCSASLPLPIGALIQNIPGSTPGVEGGFAAFQAGIIGPLPICGTRDLPPHQLSITAGEAAACIQQIANRCAAIGDPIPVLSSASKAPSTVLDPSSIFGSN